MYILIVERFAKNVNARVLKFYVAAGFFTISIFFVLNVHLFTPIEIVLGIVFTTIFFKAISNIMLSLLILLFNLDNKREELEIKFSSKKLDELLSELTVQKTAANNEKAAAEG